MGALCRQIRPWKASRLVSDTAKHGFPCSVHRPLWQQRRPLLTLAIESSCDDTCVAILEKEGSAATLHFNKKVTSDSREYGGIHPAVAVESHSASLAGLVQESLSSLPAAAGHSGARDVATMAVQGQDGAATTARRRPDLVAVTRGPGMTAALSAGLNTAKALAVAWQVPLVGVNHMQAHALTPRLVSALDHHHHARPGEGDAASPAFPFLTLLVSGGHTLLVRSEALAAHRILAQAANIAVGDVLDKCARAIVPRTLLASHGSTSYGALLERFAFPPPSSPPSGQEDASGGGGRVQRGPDYYGYVPPARRCDEIAPYASPHGWTLDPPLATTRAMRFDFSSFNGAVASIAASLPSDGGIGHGSDDDARRDLARATMRLAFEHLAGRVVFALEAERDGLKKGRRRRDASSDNAAAADGDGDEQGKKKKDTTMTTTLVVSGGVASNRFLMRVLRSFLDVRGFGAVDIVAPPPALCTDNAAMIAWAGAEMFEAGWRTELSVVAKRKWPVDPDEQGGILGVDGWVRVES